MVSLPAHSHLTIPNAALLYPQSIMVNDFAAAIFLTISRILLYILVFVWRLRPGARLQTLPKHLCCTRSIEYHRPQLLFLALVTRSEPVILRPS